MVAVCKSTSNSLEGRIPSELLASFDDVEDEDGEIDAVGDVGETGRCCLE